MTNQQLDLIVVGGGVFGLATAVEAARRGRRTLVVDRRVVPNPIAASYGPSRKIRSTYLDPHYSRLAVEAMAEWRRIEAETGRELYLAVGNLNVSDGGQDEHLETLEANARQGGAKVRWLETGDLRAGVSPVPPGAARAARGRRRLPPRHRLRGRAPRPGRATRRAVRHGAGGVARAGQRRGGSPRGRRWHIARPRSWWPRAGGRIGCSPSSAAAFGNASRGSCISKAFHRLSAARRSSPIGRGHRVLRLPRRAGPRRLQAGTAPRHRSRRQSRLRPADDARRLRRGSGRFPSRVVRARSEGLSRHLR